MMNRCLLLICLALAVGAAPSAHALDSGGPLADTAKRKRTVLRDCSGIERPPPRVKPKRIACGAVGAPDFKELRWSSWGRKAARARGQLTYRYCEPGTGCADPSNYHEAKVSLRVSRIRICDGHRAYTRLRARFTDFRGERNGYRLSLETHWAKCSTPRELRATFAI